MLLVLYSSGRHSVSIDLVAVRQWSFSSSSSREKGRCSSNTQHLFYSLRSQGQTHLLDVVRARDEHCNFINALCFLCFLHEFIIDNKAEAVKIKYRMYNVLLLFNSNDLNYINKCSLGTVCSFFFVTP